jgi:exopolysaccharide biosynthesis polyprenyl glycosylphosphotransferase
MRRWQEVVWLIFSDVVASCFAIGVALGIRNTSASDSLSFPLLAYVLPALLLSAGWVALFAYVGLYGEWSRKSRLDELFWVSKAVIFGGLLIFAITFDPNQPMPPSRIVLLSYGFTLIGLSSGGRLALRAVQRNLFKKGVGLRNTLIVGTGKRATDFAAAITRLPNLGLRVIGYLATDTVTDPSADSRVILGHLSEMASVVEARNVEDVVFAEPSLAHVTVLDVVAGCNGRKISFSVLPDLYDVVIGRSTASQLYGMPLIPLYPSDMPVWQRRTKRVLDFFAALFALAAGSPLWLGVALAVWLEDRGPILYSQNRVGKDGRVFRFHKFRSMIPNAETATGPVWAQKNDPRVTHVGTVIRKLRLDEVPQFWNVLRGEMSLVGPRPERPYFVEKLAAEIPLYRRRLHVTPGITGWAQTKQAYDQTVDDVREKLKYDLYYIENMSLRFDLLIVIRTIWVMFTGRGAQ